MLWMLRISAFSHTGTSVFYAEIIVSADDLLSVFWEDSVTAIGVVIKSIHINIPISFVFINYSQ
jgi:hypothetical protein